MRVVRTSCAGGLFKRLGRHDGKLSRHWLFGRFRRNDAGRSSASGLLKFHSDGGWSNCWATIDHANGWETSYYHLTHAILSLNNTTVSAGERIATDGYPERTPAGRGMSGTSIFRFGITGRRCLSTTPRSAAIRFMGEQTTAVDMDGMAAAITHTTDLGLGIARGRWS